MPRRLRRNLKREPLPTWMREMLMSGEMPTPEAVRSGIPCRHYLDLFGGGRDDVLRGAWVELRGEILDAFVDENPGMRPWAWWQFDAPRAPLGVFRGWLDGKLPEPRLRLGGTGTPSHEVLNYVPAFSFGLPEAWITDEDVATWPRLAGHAIDPNDPPTFEAEAAYLQRNGLLSTIEARHADFAPETIIFLEDKINAD